MVKPVTTVRVVPDLPPSLERLRELAYNLRWSWDHETIALFRRLDRDMWDRTGRNPVWMLGLVSQHQLSAAASDEAFMANLEMGDGACRTRPPNGDGAENPEGSPGKRTASRGTRRLSVRRRVEGDDGLLRFVGQGFGHQLDLLAERLPRKEDG